MNNTPEPPTTRQVLLALAVLCRKMEIDGLYTWADTVSLAIDEIKRLTKR